MFLLVSFVVDFISNCIASQFFNSSISFGVSVSVIFLQFFGLILS